ncbi:MAG: M23 family metallopeptidase [Deferrisomatales bacterium]|nr:M23 family metallopeptidase [Deferrisomatales bacterium]
MARNSPRFWVVLLLILALSGAGSAGYLLWRQKSPGPQVELLPTPRYLGSSTPLAMQLRAARGGVASVELRLVQGSTNGLVLARSFPAAPSEQRVEVTVEPAALGAREGDAELQVFARDGFWRPLAPTAPSLVVPVVVDLTPPALEVISYTRYMDQGGSGVAVLRAPEAAVAGVSVGGLEQPAFALEGAPPGVLVALFALPWDQPTPVALTAFARDEAGNTAVRGIPGEVRRKRFSTDTIELRADFMTRAVAELLPQANPSTPETLLAAFLTVNRDLRRQALEEAARVGRSSAAEVFWAGAFLQPPNTKVFANFAETRVYRWQGQEVDRQVHLGYDLASVQRAPVPAANSGVVVFAEPLTIYGNTVILDHGLGLQTLYAHLSSIGVREGERVARGQELGRTGTTGLAVGDHLHYEVLLHGRSVTPVEWWDGKWIRDRIVGPLGEGGVRPFPGGS